MNVFFAISLHLACSIKVTKEQTFSNQSLIKSLLHKVNLLCRILLRRFLSRMKYFTITIIYIFTTSFVSIEALFSLPGISWGWGGAENVTKVITSPEVLARYPLPFPYRQCSAGMEGIMTRLFVHPCSGEKYGRCQLTRGENVTLDLEFVSNIPLHSLVGSLNAIFTRWFSPLALGEPEVKNFRVVSSVIIFFRNKR